MNRPAVCSAEWDQSEFKNVLVTGIINLKACKNYKNKFEQGMINEFTVEAVDLGELEKLRIGHDNSGRDGKKGATDQK